MRNIKGGGRGGERVGECSIRIKVGLVVVCSRLRNMMRACTSAFVNKQREVLENDFVVGLLLLSTSGKRGIINFNNKECTVLL